MAVAISPQLFAALVPLNALNAESQTVIAKKAELIEAAVGQQLLRFGETESKALYLLQGAVQLEDGAGKPLAILRASDAAAAHRIGNPAPRKVAARVIEAARILVIDASLLDVMLTWDQTGAFEVAELRADDDHSGDWMSMLLQMPTFQSVPPANLQAMFMRMEQVNYPAGKVVVQQGAAGDFFYVLIEGRCLVTREVPNQKPVHLAELEAGACFGEEALLTDDPRNATVTLLTPGKLTRLAKADFRQLLNEPLTRKIKFADARREIDSGQAQWLDVRMPSEVAAAPLAGAINIPLFMLRMKLNLLNPQNRYIAVCDSGRRSSVAVFVLSQKGYDISMLDGGIPK